MADYNVDVYDKSKIEEMIFEQNILKPVRNSVKEFADRNAFYIGGTYYTYRQFAERVSAIRCTIHDWQSEEKVVAIAIHDSIDTYAAIIALWMEGKAYVPLHPNQPVERNKNIIAQVEAKHVLDSEENEAGILIPDMRSILIGCSDSKLPGLIALRMKFSRSTI